MDKPTMPQESAPYLVDGQSAWQRLLIPLKRPDDASQPLAYAIRRRAEGVPVMVSLLHVEALVAPWPIRCGGQRAPARRKQRGKSFFSESVRILEGLDVEYSTHLWSGPIVFSILDAAEQLACSEIIVPLPGHLNLHLLSQNVVTNLLTWQRSVPVITVNKRGIRQSSGHRGAATPSSLPNWSSSTKTCP